MAQEERNALDKTEQETTPETSLPLTPESEESVQDVTADADATVQEENTAIEDLPVETAVAEVVGESENVEETDRQAEVVPSAAELAPEVSETVSSPESVEEATSPVVSALTEVAEDDTLLSLQEPSETEDEFEAEPQETVDLSQLSPTELVVSLDAFLLSIKQQGISTTKLREVDELSKEIKNILDPIKKEEWDSARAKYVADNGSDDGFSYKSPAHFVRFDEIYREIRSLRSAHFQHLEHAKESNFSTKTALLQELRELVEAEETRETDAADMKASWDAFKQIQEKWKTAGNVASPHNGTLWATYNALIDRYFSIRNIYFELKELDRKRNAELKAELCQKMETLAASLAGKPISRELLDESNQLFEEFKHVGPAPREEQEVLWQRFKLAMDQIFDARRSLNEDQKKVSAATYQAKSELYETLVPLTSFSSGSINDWNTKTKEVLAIQDQWVAIKGPMPRQEGKELSKKFWAALKVFFHNKGEFFKQLESKRDTNLQAKVALCEEVEAILAGGEENQSLTQKVIELQKKWKTIGQVPEKQKDTIYFRFKKACDGYFQLKRNKNEQVEKEFEDNLVAKKALCDQIEQAAAATETTSLDTLNTFKKQWAAIGFVPKKDMQAIQKRYVAAINGYVGAIGKLSSKERERVSLDTEVEFTKEGGDSGRGMFRKESDVRRKITQLENDIALWTNNIEFFAKSKTSDKLKATFEKKIQSAETQLSELKQQLTVIREAL
jgi:hypothetical protein